MNYVPMKLCLIVLYEEYKSIPPPSGDLQLSNDTLFTYAAP